MPTVNIDKEELYAILGKDYTTDEFRELCFEFGIELEEDTSVKEMMTKELGSEKAEGLSDRPLLKIDIPANRAKVPTYTMTSPSSLIQIINKPSTEKIRPFVVGAVLRNITFTQSRYESFIDLQDKLHNNLCRKRTLVAIGTHDLDTIQAPFSYEALPPKDIEFIPLNQNQVMDGAALMEFYKSDRHISKFLHIIRDSPVYPVIFDAQRRVCSLPPIINGDHSKISVNTRNVFIECTATDLTKARTVVNTIVAMFSQYCDEPFSFEPVDVVNPDGTHEIFPQMEPRTLEVEVDYINSAAGVKLSPAEVILNLARMSLPSTEKAPGILEVIIPATRSDVLHACDVMEDVAIAYGFNNLAKTLPHSSTVGAPLPINKLTDLLRRELAFGGFDEVLSLILCSHDENFAYLHRKDPGAYAVELANPKTAEYQVIRTSLLPGLLKTVAQNRKYALPLKLFEVQDVAFIDESMERRSRNQRNVAAVYVNKSSGFEIVHGLLDRLMAMLSVPLMSQSALSTSTGPFYTIKPIDDETYFPGRAASIYYCHRGKPGSEASLIGSFGILHPGVLNNFDIDHVVTALEFNLEPFL
ncbi:phenylalanine--tRNA ligase subunit beta [Massospora cicadina]|nr:phenylalanine--tRNA ligase subunit beta [Massospora cicadina]